MRRSFAFLRRLSAGVLLALPLACLQIGASVEPSRTEHAVAAMVLECPIGSSGCPCTAGGGCDPGLTCIAGICSHSYDEVSIDGEYVFAEDTIAPPQPAPLREIRESAPRGRHFQKLDTKYKNKRASKQAAPSGNAAPAPEAAAAPVTATTVDVTAGGNSPDQPAAGPSLAELGRQIIYTATLHVAVFGLDPAIELAESIPERYGGWIESRNNYQLTLRVPAEHLFEVIEQLSALGVVLGKTLQAEDVTAEYVDLDARIRVLEHIVAQLELLLQQATSVEEALKIRVELDRIRIELEAARARMRQLSEMIDFSTLVLYLSERGIEAPSSSNDPFPWVDSLGAEATEYR